MPYVIRPRRARYILAAAFASILVTTTTAPAVASAACPAAPTTQAFASLGDTANYSLLQGGSFEGGAPGWSLAGSKVIVDTVEPFKGRHVLAIKPKGRVVSPAFCVSSEDPTVRFDYRILAGGGKMNVDVRWSEGGKSHEILDAEITTTPSWTASPVMQLATVLPLPAPGSTLNTVQLVFTDTHPGLSYAISEVYVDPYSR
jgi:hypothetical protein